MLGVLVGIGLAVAFMKFRHRWGWGGFGFAGRCGSHRGQQRRGRWATRWLFQRLQTSPGQEKVILEAWEAVSEKGARLKDEWRQGRSDIARAVRGSTLDDAALKDAQARQDGVLSEVRETLRAQLAKVHEALDERQRRDFAALIEMGPRASGHGGGW